MKSRENQEDSFFCDLLKQFRHRKGLTQKQLAERIGVVRESVSFWERGNFKPETTTIYLLADVLGLDDNEKRLLFEAHLGTAASILPLYNLPKHNPYFTGREEILNSLHTHLTASKQDALIEAQAITGLGGVGKTQAAIEYAYRFRGHYHDILWAAADSREALITSYLTLATYLRLREREEREQRKVVEAVKRWLREHKSWLLILDNLEDLGLVNDFVPTPRQGAVVLTTRREETKPIAHPIRLNVMAEEEGVLFLLRRVGYLSTDTALETASANSKATALAIVQAMGRLPLALDQAGAYITETKRGLSDYLELFKQQQTALLERRGDVPSDHPESVTKTFSLAFEQVRKQNEFAIELLTICAFLAPDAIPLEVITKAGGTTLKPVAVNGVTLDDALRPLLAYSLVQRDGERRTLSIHRLVQAIIRGSLDRQNNQKWAERVIQAMNEAFPDVEYANWSHCEQLLSHALVCVGLVETYQINHLEAASLLDKTGHYLYERARYQEAEPLKQRVLATYKQQLGLNHPQTAVSMDKLATVYQAQGKYEQAETLYQEAVTIYEQLQEPDLFLKAQSLNNLAQVCYVQSKYEPCEALYQEALLIHERMLGHEHPKTAQILYNLAALFHKQNEYTQAEPLYKDALAIRKRCLEPEHPDMAQSLNGLAGLYTDQERYAEATPLCLHALAICEQELGPEHPHTAQIQWWLATLARRQNNLDEASRLYKQALHVFEQRLGATHSRTQRLREQYEEMIRSI